MKGPTTVRADGDEDAADSDSDGDRDPKKRKAKITSLQTAVADLTSTLMTSLNKEMHAYDELETKLQATIQSASATNNPDAHTEAKKPLTLKYLATAAERFVCKLCLFIVRGANL